MNKKTAAVTAAAAVPAGLLGAAAVKALITGKKVKYVPKADAAREGAYARKLSEMVKYETVSVIGKPDPEKFEGFHKLLAELFPNVFTKTEVNSIDGSLLIFWKGRSSDRPLILMGHQDVVAAEGKWEHEPFSGDICDGKIWGRGTADTKCSLMAFLQAAEELLTAGYIPANDVYMCSSCTEEVGGDGGPKTVAELKRRGVKPWLVCDEGGAIVMEPVGGVKGPFAMIGVLEKGVGNLCFTARSGGGHASAPPKKSPIARLAAFINEIENNSPLYDSFEPAVEDMFSQLAPYSPFAYRLLLGNLKFFKPLLIKVLPKLSNEAGALLHTTIAFTMQSGSEGLNVLPQEAKVYANMRFIPHQNMEASIAAVKKVADKYGIETEVIDGNDHNEPISTQSSQFGLMERVIGEVFPGLPVIPYVMTGATDARFYEEICSSCMRFSPVLYGQEQMKGMHGLNECLDTVSLPGAVDFYKTLIRNNI